MLPHERFRSPILETQRATSLRDDFWRRASRADSIDPHSTDKTSSRGQSPINKNFSAQLKLCPDTNRLSIVTSAAWILNDEFATVALSAHDLPFTHLPNHPNYQICFG